MTAGGSLRHRSATASGGTIIVLRGARVGLGGPPGDVVVVDGVVRDVAPAGSVRPPRDADLLDLGDATVLPGLVDHHVHVDQWARRSRRVDVSDARDAEAAAQLVRRHLDTVGLPARGDVVTAYGFVDGLWPAPPHRDLLDAVLDGERSGVAVAVVSADLHMAWLSRAALTLVGRDGHATGVLREQECMDAVRLLAAAEPDDVLDGLVAESLAGVPARGVTAVSDFEHADTVTSWRRRAAREHLPVRIEAVVWLPWLDRAIAEERRTGDLVEGTAGMVTVGPFKLMCDGSLNTRTAWCHTPYPDRDPRTYEDAHGLSLISPDELVTLMSRAWSAGLEPAVHAIGDAANTAALDAFEAVDCPGRIEHAQMVDWADLPRFARPGLIASVQPQHAVADRDVADVHWSGRTDRAFAYRSLHDAGAHLRFGSDAPVSPLDPWHAVADAVARTDDGRDPWHPEQALPLEIALTAACGGRRTVAAGDPADLVVVPGDIHSLPVADLRHIPVLATLVGGRFTHRL